MNYLSLFAGIEAATVAWHPLGWRAVAFAEIDPFASALLAHRYPDVPNWGDVTRYSEWPDADVDVLVGGSPCQSFSVAGLRRGLADPRGNLTLTYLAVVARYRPRWVVWENVPGVLSDDRGRTFGTFLGALGELGYGWAYRILDAQYFGLAQRRKRVFVVGCARGWAGAAAVLLERASLRWNPAPCREAGQGVARPIAAGTAHGSGYRNDADTAASLVCGADENDARAGRLIAHPLRGDGFDVSEDGTGRGVPLVPDVCPALKARDHKGPSSDGDGDGAILVPIAFANTGGATNLCISEGGEAPPLTTRNGDPGNVLLGISVRRMMPRECERLQGFPDDYTLIPYRSRPAKDGPRYRALGNSMAVSVMRWIGRRIARVDVVLARGEIARAA